MYSRLLTPPAQRKSFFLFGPRGTGKSSWVKTHFPQGLYLDLLESELFNDLLAAPERLESLIPKGFRDWIILDEIQRIPDLLNEVHRLIEGQKLSFVLTGSSARKLRRKGVNLLGGRALTCSMHPLTAVELGQDFRLRHSLQFGQLPCAYTEQDPKAYLESYVHSYLREEVQQEGLTRSLASFSRFLEAASFSQASVLNISTVARECGVERKAVEGYFTILEDLMLARMIFPFTRRAKRRVVTHPKFYFFDTGVFRTLRPLGPLDSPQEADGPALETLFLNEIQALNAYKRLGYEIFFWRTATGAEVDFVLYGPRGLKAFEIKRTARFQDSSLSGLLLFLQDYPMAQAHFLYAGARPMHVKGVQILPIEDTFKHLVEFL